MEDLAIENTPINEKEVTTTFVDAGPPKTMTLSVPAPVSIINTQMQGIRDFLAKPSLYTQFDWTTTSVPGDKLATIIPTSALVDTKLYEKWKGFNLFNGTMVVKIVLNAQPFQQGRLLLSFFPNSGIAAYSANMRSKHLTLLTQLPNVELDCRDTAVEMRVPYIAPTRFLNLKTFEYDFGDFSLHCLASLRTGVGASVTTVGITVYTWFEDVELNAPIVPQSSGKRVSRVSFKKNTETSAMVDRPISEALSLAVKSSSAFGRVPLLAPLATRAEWALRAASGLASSLGWSKPPIEAVQQPVGLQNMKHSATATGGRSAAEMSLDSTNKIKVLTDITPRAEDEMSWDFLKKVQAYIFTYNWTTAAAPGTVIKRYSITPSNFFNTINITHGGHTAVLGVGPPIWYFTNYMKYWRGSVEVIFKIVKTQFHTGRLEFTFTPYGATPTYPDTASSFYAIREIVDLSTQDEIVLKIPFISEYNYLDVGNQVGVLQVMVLNELRTPDTAANNVDILMFIRGGDDFELQVPCNLNQKGSSYNPVPIYPQGGDLEIQSGELEVNEPIAGQTTTGPTLELAEESIGETFRSVKQLLNRSIPITFFSSGNVGTGFAVWPWKSPLTYMDQTTGVLTTSVLDGDMYGPISWMYAYYRGSAYLDFSWSTDYSDPTATTATPSFNLSTGYLTGGSGALNTTSNWNGNASQLTTNNWTGAQGATWANGSVGLQTVHVPYYSRTRCSLVSWNGPGAGTTIPTDTSQPITSVSLNLAARTNTKTTAMLRSFGDDFQLAYFVGCPPILQGYS